MTHRIRIRSAIKSCIASLFFAASTAGAQASFPAKPVTLVVPYGAGSTTDLYARILAEGLTSELKQAVVVENRPGAGGTVGIGQALRAEPDGHTLMLVTSSSIAINGSLYTSLPFDPAKDVSVIAVLNTTPNALIVPASAKETNFAQFAQRIQSGKHFYFSQGSGTSQHLSNVLLGRVLKADLEHVPYRGQEGIAGMLGGQTEFGFASLPSILTLAKGGKLRILAVSGSKPVPSMPDIPTLASLGYKDFAAGEVWYGVGVSAATPATVKEQLSAALDKVAEKPEIRAKLNQAGFEPVAPMTAAQRQAFVDQQVEFWGRLVRESGAKVD